MPIVIQHGGAGTFEQSEDLRRSVGTLLDAKRIDQRDEQLAQQDQRYQAQIQAAQAKLDLEDQEKALAAQAANLGAAGLSTARTGMVPPGLEGLLAPSSELGLQPGRDFRQVFDERMARLIQDPDLSQDARKQLLADAEEMQVLEIRQKEAERLGRDVEFAANTIEGYDAEEAQLVLEDLDAGEISPVEAKRLLAEHRAEAMFNNTKGAASALYAQALQESATSATGTFIDPERLQAIGDDLAGAKWDARPGGQYDFRPALAELKTMLNQPITTEELDAVSQSGQKIGFSAALKQAQAGPAAPAAPQQEAKPITPEFLSSVAEVLQAGGDDADIQAKIDALREEHGITASFQEIAAAGAAQAVSSGQERKAAEEKKAAKVRADNRPARSKWQNRNKKPEEKKAKKYTKHEQAQRGRAWDSAYAMYQQQGLSDEEIRAKLGARPE